MKLQLKRSNVLDGGSAKVPTSSQLEYGELAVNYNGTDPVLFIKDSNDAVIRIAGAGAPGGGGGAGDGLVAIPDGNTFDLAVQAETGKGIGVSSNGVAIGDDWSNIPSLP